MDNQQSKKRAAEWKYLLEVIQSLRYLSQQRTALEDEDRNDNFTQLLHLLSTNNKKILCHLEGKIGHTYTHNDVQNQILDIRLF